MRITAQDLKLLHVVDRIAAITVTGCPSRKPMPPMMAGSSRKLLSPWASTKLSKILAM